MERIYQNFYRNLYRHSGGYFSTIPYNRIMLPGDFFQIQNGEVIVLGNIFRSGIIDKADVSISSGNRMSASPWQFGQGVSKAFSSRGTGEAPLGGHFHYSRQVLVFKEKSSFLFAGHQPESARIVNWPDICQQLIIRMTQGIFSFREVYVVTESVSHAEYTLAIGGVEGAELEIATDTSNADMVDIFGHPGSRTVQSKDIEFYHREKNRKAVFFKAKKLAVSVEMKTVFIKDLIQRVQHLHREQDDVAEYTMEEDDQYLSKIQANGRECVLDMLSVNELNPNTALRFFKWVDAGPDDMEKLFINYGNN